MYKSTDPIADIERQEKIEQLRSEEAERAEAEAVAKQRKKLSVWRKLLRFFGWLLLIGVLTGAAAAAVWFLWLKNDQPTASVNKDEQGRMIQPAPPPVEVAETTESYSSDRLFLQFKYPKGWKVTEDNKIVAISPPTKLKTTTGATQTGEIVMTIRSTQTTLPEFNDGDARAILESEKITYAKPTQTQRAATYISLLSYAGAKSKGLDAVYVTGDSGYVINQLIPMADIVVANPLVTVSFQACPEPTCAANSARTPLTIATSNWQNEKFSQPVKTMLESLIVE